MPRIEWRKHPEYAEFLVGCIPGHSEAEIRKAFLDRFGIELTESQIGNFKQKSGVKSGTVGGRFERGHVSANKGRPQSEWMPPESIERTKATRFKPGRVPHNALGKGIGYERVGKDGYIEVKVKDGLQGEANDNFEFKHRVVWERANGRKLRKGEVVLFADGDRLNFDPANLVVATRAENIALMRMGRPYSDRETLESALAVARLRMGVSRAELRPRACRRCGEEFAPRYARQRTCDVCLGRN